MFNLYDQYTDEELLKMADDHDCGTMDGDGCSICCELWDRGLIQGNPDFDEYEQYKDEEIKEMQ